FLGGLGALGGLDIFGCGQRPRQVDLLRLCQKLTSYVRQIFLLDFYAIFSYFHKLECKGESE
ncbi:hypothetical protein JXA02_12835, partial [candidate division KSB1 bacterium]|nr:hypothetical protein [candidate division KSB1 bacterium]